jgi:hypothetical protein
MGMFHVKRSRYANLVQENEPRRGSGKNEIRSPVRVCRFKGDHWTIVRDSAQWKDEVLHSQ